MSSIYRAMDLNHSLEGKNPVKSIYNLLTRHSVLWGEMCMCTCASAHKHTHTHTHTHTRATGPEVNIKCLSPSLSALTCMFVCLFVCLRQDLALSLECTFFHQTWLTNKFPLGSACLCHHSAGISGVCHPVGFLCGCRGTELGFTHVPSEPSSPAFATQCPSLV